MIRAGAAVIDITPPAGLAMAGFGARAGGALGAHDALTARAICVEDTALLIADVIGLHEDMSRRIRARCCLPDANVTVAALHNHGGPASMPKRAGGGTDKDYLQRLEDACVAAIDEAAARTVPARIFAGSGSDPGIARNRRSADGPLDRALPVLRIDAASGGTLAVLVSYACHPVVLGADNRLWTADYPHFVRRGIEAAYPGAAAVFATGCCGDANTGHTAQASMSLAANPARTFAAAESIGKKIAASALAAELKECAGPVSASETEAMLEFARRDAQSPGELAKSWRLERKSADSVRATILDHWIAWAEIAAQQELKPWRARVSALNWRGVPIAALPGEIFAETALSIRASAAPGFVLAYAEGNPGYIPPRSEFQRGGYEIDEAHRYYGMPAVFAPGSAEALADAAIALLPPAAAY